MYSVGKYSSCIEEEVGDTLVFRMIYDKTAKSHIELYIRALRWGPNRMISAECAKVKAAIWEFRATIPFQTLDAVKAMDGKLEHLPSNLIEALRGNVQPADLQALWDRITPLERISQALKDSQDLDVDVKVLIQRRTKFLEKTFVPGTFTWLDDESTYKSWLNGHRTPFIYVHGAAGTGKTFFCYSCFKSIQRQANEDNYKWGKSSPRHTKLVSYFPFAPGKRQSQSFRSVLAYILLQIAACDSNLSESIAKDLVASKVLQDKEANEDQKLNFLWDKLVKKFKKTADIPRIVYILLDGIELMDNVDRTAMLRLFQTLNAYEDGIRVLMTGPADEDLQSTIFKFTDCHKIDLLEKIRLGDDFGKFIDSHLRESEALRNYQNSTKKTIRHKLLENTESKFYKSWRDESLCNYQYGTC